MRVVLDANVLISAVISRGPSHDAVQAWFTDRPFELIICERRVDDVTSVLTTRPRLRRWITLEAAELFMARLVTAADVHPDPPPGPVLSRDPDDDYVIHLARQHGADLIVSSDADLLDWADQDPPVITPALFMQRLRET